MKLRKIVKEDGSKEYIVLLTYDEEHEFAKRFFNIMSRHWLGRYSDFQELARRLFVKKSYGNNFRESDFMEFAGWLDKINNKLLEFENADVWLIEDPFSVLTMDGDHIQIPMPQYSSKRTFRDNIKRYEREVARAWKEAWKINGKKVYPDFPGDEILSSPPKHYEREERERDKKIELNFWERVKEVQIECGCSRKQALAEVSDYMFRAKHKENRITDPEPDMIVTPEVYIDD